MPIDKKTGKPKGTKKFITPADEEFTAWNCLFVDLDSKHGATTDQLLALLDRIPKPLSLLLRTGSGGLHGYICAITPLNDPARGRALQERFVLALKAIAGQMGLPPKTVDSSVVNIGQAMRLPGGERSEPKYKGNKIRFHAWGPYIDFSTLYGWKGIEEMVADLEAMVPQQQPSLPTHHQYRNNSPATSRNSFMPPEEAMERLAMILKKLGTVAKGDGNRPEAFDCCQCYFAAAKEGGWAADHAGLENLLLNHGADSTRVANLMEAEGNCSSKTGGGLVKICERHYTRSEIDARLGKRPRTRNLLPTTPKAQQQRDNSLMEQAQALTATPNMQPTATASDELKALSYEEMGSALVGGHLDMVTASLPPQYPITKWRLFLSALSNAIKGPGLVRTRGGWFEPLNDYVLLVGDSGQKKSPLLDAMVTDPLEKLKDLYSTFYRADKRKKEHEDGTVTEEDCTVPVKAHLIDEGTGTVEGLRDWMVELEETEAGRMKLNPGVVVICDEMKTFLGSLDSYSLQDKRAAFLKWFGGRSGGGVARSTWSKPKILKRANIGLIGGIQGSVLNAAMAAADAAGNSGDGFLARFVFLPQAPFGSVDFDSLPEDAAVEHSMTALQDWILQAHAMEARGLVLEHPAQKLMHSFSEEMGFHNSNPNLSTIEKQIMGKAAGKAMRLAGLLWILHAVTHGEALENMIPLEILQTAIRMQRLLDQYAVNQQLAHSFSPEQALHEYLGQAYPNGAVTSFQPILDGYRRIPRPKLGRTGEISEMLQRYGCRKSDGERRRQWLIPPAVD